jgi:photosystem II stability/assembly factor-like uncharacterized protein
MFEGGPMKAILLLVSLLVLSSVASAQITQPENNQPQDAERGWVQIPTGSTTAWLRSVTATPSGNVWAGGPDLMLKSTNFGVNWTQAETPVKGLIKFYDDSIGILAAGANSVFLTSDGGRNWIAGNSTESQVLHDIAYASKTNVFAVGIAGVSKSTNGGKTWFNRQLDASDLNCIHFADSLHGFIGAARPSIDFGSIFRTTNGGESWIKEHTPAYETEGIFALTRDSIICVSGEGYVFATTDKGDTWTTQLITPLYEGANAIDFANEKEGYVAGWVGRIYRTTDRGLTWHKQNTPTTKPLYSIDFINDSIGFASGDSGILLRTSNKGVSWVQVFPKPINIAVRTFPEPFRTSVNFEFENGSECAVSLSIYAVDGRLIYATDEEPGTHQILVASAGWEAGVYLYSLKLCGQTYQGKITLAPVG